MVFMVTYFYFLFWVFSWDLKITLGRVMKFLLNNHQLKHDILVPFQRWKRIKKTKLILRIPKQNVKKYKRLQPCIWIYVRIQYLILLWCESSFKANKLGIASLWMCNRVLCFLHLNKIWLIWKFQLKWIDITFTT